MKIPHPAELRHQAKPFDDPDWLFELKHDGFRALAILQTGKARFVSRHGGRLNGFGILAHELARVLKAQEAILDGEIAVPHQTGRTVFARPMERRHETRYYAKTSELCRS